MDQHLEILSDIHNLVWVLVILMGIVALANVIRAGTICHEKIFKKRAFMDEASDLYESGKLDELISLCNKHLGGNPEDPYAYWFIGRAYYGKNDYKQANGHFEKTLRLRPLWNDQWVEPYMSQIRTENENH